MAKSLVSATKSKNFTFRITEALTNDIAELKLQCQRHGLRMNMTEALTAALEREIKAVQKAIQKLDPSWEPGQMALNIDSADAHTKEGSKKGR